MRVDSHDGPSPEELKEFDLRTARKSVLWDGAVRFLCDWFPDHVKEDIRQRHQEDPEYWWAPYHLFWGMGVRNKLRDEGFGEDDFGIHNLDNIYVELVEEAVDVTTC